MRAKVAAIWFIITAVVICAGVGCTTEGSSNGTLSSGADNTPADIAAPTPEALTDPKASLQAEAPVYPPQESAAREAHAELQTACRNDDIASVIRYRDMLKMLGKEEWLTEFNAGGWPGRIEAALAQERSNATIEKPFLDSLGARLHVSEAILRIYELHINAPPPGPVDDHLKAIARYATLGWDRPITPPPVNSRLSSVYNDIVAIAKQVNDYQNNVTYANTLKLAELVAPIILKMRKLFPASFRVEPLDLSMAEPAPRYFFEQDLLTRYASTLTTVTERYELMKKLDEAAGNSTTVRNSRDDRFYDERRRQEIKHAYRELDELLRDHAMDPVADKKYDFMRRQVYELKMLLVKFSMGTHRGQDIRGQLRAAIDERLNQLKSPPEAR